MYIRTKDGRIAEVKENMTIKRCSENVLRLVYKDNRSICVLSGNDDIVNQAKNIEDLCDEFVVWLNENNCHFTTTNYLYIYQNRDKAKSVFGAIWTDKGLIFVAKMNDKGDLELI